MTGCRSITSAEGERPDPVTPAGIEVVADGGIAAMHWVVQIDSASGAVTSRQAPICPLGVLCKPVDPIGGHLSRQLVDGLFARAAASEFRRLRADYGLTAGGADMRTYTLTIHANGRVRTLHADDGTMPTLMAEFVNDVLGSISQADKG